MPIPHGLEDQRSRLVDGFDRRIEYLRISITDRCNYRCSYCMGSNPTFLPKRDILDLDEMDRLASAFVRSGVRRLRLTGGEPLTRRGLVTLVRALSRHRLDGSLDEITMTTNGSLLARHAAELADAGMQRINVSLDTLDPEVFAQVTRGGRLSEVLAGLDAARAAGLGLKINAVIQRGINDHAIDDLLEFAHGRGIDLALIETMPIGRVEADRSSRHVPLSVIRDDLERRWSLVDLPDRTAGPARYAGVLETGGRIAFITPLSHGFCESCNRVRLTCDGRLTLCLGRNGGVDLRAVLRASESDAPLLDAIQTAIAAKPRGHDFAAARFDRSGVDRPMHQTGG